MKKEFFLVLKLYCLSWIISIGVILAFSLRSDITLEQAFTTLKQLFYYFEFILSVHFLFLLLYLLVVTVRYFLRLSKKRSKKVAFQQFFYRLFLPIMFIVLAYHGIVNYNQQEDYSYEWNDLIENKLPNASNNYKLDAKQRGMHVFGWRKNNTKAIDELVRNNIEWVAVVPFFYQKDEQTNQISFEEREEWSNRDSLFIKTIQQLHDRNIRVMLKPHLWLTSGWRANIHLNKSEDWELWFDSYQKAMLHYTKLAAVSEVELLCIGTELKSSIQRQTQRWTNLIQKIKTNYTGKLTYAANWDDEYEHVHFWSELDYIGIQAYFPLTEGPNPDLNTIKEGWNEPINKLEALSQQYNKPILFTEVGYKSEISATVTPWKWDHFFSALFRKKSDKTQKLAYEALFEMLWNKDWFAGIYIWQWDIRSTAESATKNLDFSPRFKPAENIMAKWFSKNANTN